RRIPPSVRRAGSLPLRSIATTAAGVTPSRRAASATLNSVSSMACPPARGGGRRSPGSSPLSHRSSGIVGTALRRMARRNGRLYTAAMGRRGWTDAELVELAKQHGWRVSARQLERWHKADVLPRPVQDARASKGTTSAYPPGTDASLLAACRLKAAGKGRPL